MPSPRIADLKVRVYKSSVFILGSALAAAVWLGVLAQTRAEYHRQVSSIETEMNGQTLVLASHVVRTLKEMDRALLIIRDYINVERVRNGGTIPWETIRVPSQDVLGATVMQIGLTDENGRFRVSNVPIDPTKPLDHSNRDHFRVHRNSRADQLYISVPVLGRLTGLWYLQVSRPLGSGSGGFAGIITGSLNPAQFFAIYPPIDVGSDGSMSIVGLDGMVRASLGPRALQLGTNRSDLGVVEAIYGRTFRTRLQDSGNGRSHFVAYRKVEGYPLVLRVEKAKDEALANYYLWRSYYSLFGAGLTAIIALGVFGGAQYQQRLRQAAETARLSEELARRKSRELALTLDHIGQGILMVDDRRRIVFMNDLARKLGGLPPEFDATQATFDELMETLRKQGEFTKGQGDEDQALIERLLKPGRSAQVDVCHRTRPDGTVLEIRTAALPEGGFVRTLTDVTQRRRSELALAQQNALLQRQEEELRAQNVRFDMALRNMTHGLCMFDAEQRLVVCNERYIEMYGLPPELTRPGTTLREILSHREASGLVNRQADEYVRELTGIFATRKPWTTVRKLADGRAISVITQPMPGGGWVATHEDVTERQRAEAKILHMAEHDALTDLPNRILFRGKLNSALYNVRQNGRLAVLMLDLDRFKEVNDTLGHPVGDALLRHVAERLRGCLREADVVARLGGDEFAILAAAIESTEDAAALARRIQVAMDEPFELDGQHFVIATSIGISVAPEDGIDPDQLLKNADMALYRAKREGHGVYRFFEPEMNRRMQMRRELEYGLRHALANNEFELWYQPFVNLQRDEVCGFEALLRWNHPDRCRASPADFIPLAEETGLIVPIGEWVLRQACSEAANWPDRLRISVNLSAAQFKGRSLVQTVVSALAASGLRPDRLELEITESVMLQDSEVAFKTLSQLKELGVRIALDDFGTGYSSLSYLRRFPFGRIKIDRGFISELTAAREDSLAIVRSVIRLGSSLGMATTAEGVETKQQLDRVRAEGCTEMQGYYFSPPRPAAEILSLLRQPAYKSADAA
ncbi:MAG TPA: EAL domain-containing protein [Hyphomicrobiaceae bacterium]|nr:EAL domain-containing protein [Hyphomicrobiaceae bacterium]